MKLYCCGGCGTNIGSMIKNLDLDICYIDTSTSNSKNIKSDNIHILDGVEGAGKDRSKTYNYFSKEDAENLLIKFKPAHDLNIVISSLSGGSGSLLGALIVKELVSNDHNVLVIAVDSKNSIKELDNSINTLKTYKSISDTTKKAISLFYIENSDRAKSDSRAIWFINLLSVLLNKELSDEFDTTDLHHWLNFNKVTDNSPSVAVIEVGLNEPIMPEKNTNIAATILMTTDRQTSIKPVIPDYLASCVVTDPNCKMDDVRIDNVLGKLASIISDMEDELKELHNAKKINKHKEVVVTNANSDGIVL